ncbi:MAG: pantoate--beta-alanine ligase [Pseudomonadota bacterium]|nr:pantoate--beta-alanine ligase [Pseudomonadota bacterium]
MQTADTIAAVRQQVAAWRRAGERIAFVPTMGNLHDGHLHLVERAKQLAERVVVTVFVNPMQFGPNEDFERYPRTLAADTAKLQQAGVDLLFAPPLEEIYPAGHRSATQIAVVGVSEGLCGASRPGHFVGVATVVAKLFNIVQADVALFGEKDYQQLQVIRQLVADLCFPIEVVGVATVREADGLAMSSRNAFLSETERALAPIIYQSLLAATARIQAGERDYRRVEAAVQASLKQVGLEPDYFAIVDADTLKPAAVEQTSLRLLVAAHLGQTRLIDNMALSLLK